MGVTEKVGIRKYNKHITLLLINTRIAICSILFDLELLKHMIELRHTSNTGKNTVLLSFAVALYPMGRTVLNFFICISKKFIKTLDLEYKVYRKLG